MSPPEEWPYTRTLGGGGPTPVCSRMTDNAQLEFGVVVGKVGDEVRRLAVSPRPAAFLQVQRIEGEATIGEVIGQRGVEEVVGVAVHRQDRVAAAPLGSPRRTSVATMSPSPAGSDPSGIVHCQ